MTIGIDYGLSFQRRQRAQRRMLRKALHTLNTVRLFLRAAASHFRQFVADVRFVAALWRSIGSPTEPEFIRTATLALIDGRNGGATVIREGNALVHMRGPHFNNTVQA